VILQYQGTGRMTGFLLNKDHSTVTRDLADYQLEISLDEIFGYRADQGYGLVVAVGPNEFVGSRQRFSRVLPAQNAGSGAGRRWHGGGRNLPRREMDSWSAFERR